MLVNITGIDGSGKTTQCHEVYKYLMDKGIYTRLFDFPSQRTNFFGKQIRTYLEGGMGPLEDVPINYIAALFGMDREQYKISLQEMGKSKTAVGVCSRYIDDNVIYNVVRYMEEGTDLDAFYQQMEDWVYYFEYHFLELPEADIQIYLDCTPDLAMQNIRESGRSVHDCNENVDFLTKVRNMYMRGVVAEKFECVSTFDFEGNMYPKAKITEQIVEVLKSYKIDWKS